MTKKKHEDIPEIEAAPEVKPQAKKYFSRAMWKGVKEVHKCEICGTFRDEKDAIIEHVLLHFPQSEQVSILDKLLKE